MNDSERCLIMSPVAAVKRGKTKKNDTRKLPQQQTAENAFTNALNDSDCCLMMSPVPTTRGTTIGRSNKQPRTPLRGGNNSPFLNDSERCLIMSPVGRVGDGNRKPTKTTETLTYLNDSERCLIMSPEQKNQRPSRSNHSSKRSTRLSPTRQSNEPQKRNSSEQCIVPIREDDHETTSSRKTKQDLRNLSEQALSPLPEARMHTSSKSKTLSPLRESKREGERESRGGSSRTGKHRRRSPKRSPVRSPTRNRNSRSKERDSLGGSSNHDKTNRPERNREPITRPSRNREPAFGRPSRNRGGARSSSRDSMESSRHSTSNHNRRTTARRRGSNESLDCSNHSNFSRSTRSRSSSIDGSLDGSIHSTSRSNRGSGGGHGGDRTRSLGGNKTIAPEKIGKVVASDQAYTDIIIQNWDDEDLDYDRYFAIKNSKYTSSPSDMITSSSKYRGSDDTASVISFKQMTNLYKVLYRGQTIYELSTTSRCGDGSGTTGQACSCSIEDDMLKVKLSNLGSSSGCNGGGSSSSSSALVVESFLFRLEDLVRKSAMKKQDRMLQKTLSTGS